MSKIIITIGRQFGSGGQEIGKKLASKLGISFYDRELITMAAKQSGVDLELFENADEKPTSSFLYSLALGNYIFDNRMPTASSLPLNDRLFLIQSDIIKTVAQKESCVIVGRCGDYVLRDFKTLNLFIHADVDARVKRISQLYKLNEHEALDLITKTDKKRASYYNYYTSQKWSDMQNYDLTLNSLKLGVDNTVELIENAVKEFFK